MQMLTERVKQEQVRIEQMAKKRSALLSAKDKSNVEDFAALNNGNKKRRRKQIEVFLNF